jgi:hypothetical protein
MENALTFSAKQEDGITGKLLKLENDITKHNKAEI